MARHQGTVLVDTNVILECWRMGSWRALAGGYALNTVDDCITETQTGFQRHRKTQQIDAKELLASLSAPPYAVSDLERAETVLRVPDIHLDRGEWSLWAYALARKDGWILCGPDR